MTTNPSFDDTHWLDLKSVLCVLPTPAVLIRSLQFLLLTKKKIPGGEEIEEEVEVQKRSLSIKCKATGHDLKKITLPEDEAEIRPSQ